MNYYFNILAGTREAGSTKNQGFMRVIYAYSLEIETVFLNQAMPAANRLSLIMVILLSHRLGGEPLLDGSICSS
jgi:hypothetical protein